MKHLKYIFGIIAATTVFPGVVLYGASVRQLHLVLVQLDLGLPWRESSSEVILSAAVMIHLFVTGVVIWHWVHSLKEDGDS